MEAGWGGTTLKLEGTALAVVLEGQAPVLLTLDALTGFTILRREEAEAARLATGPGGSLVLGWLTDSGKKRALSIPMPSPALQVEFFVARLSQLLPEKDLQAVPAAEALRVLTPPRASRLSLVGILLLIAALLAVALFALV